MIARDELGVRRANAEKITSANKQQKKLPDYMTGIAYFRDTLKGKIH